DLIAAPLRRLQPERHRPFLARRRAQTRKALEPLPPTLRLAGVLPRDVAADVILLLRDRAPLLVELPLLREPALLALVHERRVAAGVREGAPLLEVEDVVNHPVEEGAVVAHHDHRLAGAAQVFLE